MSPRNGGISTATASLTSPRNQVSLDSPFGSHSIKSPKLREFRSNLLIHEAEVSKKGRKSGRESQKLITRCTNAVSYNSKQFTWNVQSTISDVKF